LSTSVKALHRYSIHWVSLDPTKGREVQKTRPCVVVSPDPMHRTGMAVVCPLTTALHPDWFHRLQVQSAGEPAEIMVDQIRAVSTERIGKRIDYLTAQDAEALRQLIAALYATP
jgi:mRNA interferase MazF